MKWKLGLLFNKDMQNVKLLLIGKNPHKYKAMNYSLRWHKARHDSLTLNFKSDLISSTWKVLNSKYKATKFY